VKLLVHKYGGSSLADSDKISNVAERITRTHKEGINVVVVCSAMGDTTDNLLRLASDISKNPDPRELDLLLSTGELVSATLLAMAISNLGYKAVSLSGLQAGIKTDNMYGKARIDSIDPERIHSELEKGNIVIVAGFQGINTNQDVTTLGRGGSDTTAVALAAALNADRCEVYTDVDGIYTADPRIVQNARKIKQIGYEEMLELASYGAKMHPRSIELGSVYNVPIYVASSFNDDVGTLIDGLFQEDNVENRIKVTGIAYQRGISKITLRDVPDKPGLAAALFEPLTDNGISVDKTTDISFTVDNIDSGKTLETLETMPSLLGSGQLISENDLAMVSIVGSGMQNTPGYASRMFTILAEGKINIDMITTSEIRISCIILEKDVESAVQLLHQGFQLDKIPS
jgi:aspartate kinase